MKSVLVRAAVVSLMAALFLQVPAGAQPAREASGGSLASLVSDDAVLVLEVKHRTKLREQLRASPLGKAIEDSPTLKAIADFAKAGGNLASQILAETSQDEVKAMTPNKWALFVFALPEAAGDLDEPANVLVGELDEASKGFPSLCTDRLFPGIERLMDGLEIAPYEHRGAKAMKITKPDGRAFHMAFTRRYAVLGNEPGVKKFLDCCAASGKKLSGAERYAKTSKGFDGAALATAYLDLTPGISATLSELEEGSKKMRDMHFLGTYALQTIGASVLAAGDEFHEKVLLTMNDEYDQAFMGILRTRKPIRMKSPKVVPANYGGHLALSVTDGADLLNALQELVAAVHGQAAALKFDEVAELFRTQFAIDLERDLLGRLGPEVFLALAVAAPEKWVTEKRKPRRQDFDILFGFETREPDGVKTTLRNLFTSPLLTQQGATLAVETLKDVEVNVFRHPNVPFGGVSYAFVDGFLVVALEQETLRKALEARAAKRTLAGRRDAGFNAAPLNQPVVASLYLDLKPLIPKLAPALLAKANPKVRPFAPAITEALTAVGQARLAMKPTEQGLLVESRGPLPLLTSVVTLAAADRLAKPRVGRYAKDAEERMKELGKALRKYYRKNQAPPDTLIQLVPSCIAELPQDPFSPAGDFRFGVSEGGAGWILASVGPDGKPNVNVDQYHAEKWQTMMRSQDAAVMATAKKLLYRFRHKRFHDERAADDEGDIVRTGRW